MLDKRGEGGKTAANDAASDFRYAEDVEFVRVSFWYARHCKGLHVCCWPAHHLGQEIVVMC